MNEPHAKAQAVSKEPPKHSTTGPTLLNCVKNGTFKCVYACKFDYRSDVDMVPTLWAGSHFDGFLLYVPPLKKLIQESCARSTYCCVFCVHAQAHVHV